MAFLLLRDVPDQIYQKLVDQAKRERRSLSKQTVVVLARGLDVELDAKARRQAVLADLRAHPPVRAKNLTDPVRLIREDRSR